MAEEKEGTKMPKPRKKRIPHHKKREKREDRADQKSTDIKSGDHQKAKRQKSHPNKRRKPKVKKKLTKKEIEAKKKQQQEAEDEYAASVIPIYMFPNVMPLIYYIHQHLKHITPLKVSAVLYYSWAFYAGITADKQNQQLFIPIFNADKELGIYSRAEYDDEKRHKFDYMQPQTIDVDPFVLKVVDIAIAQLEPLTDDDIKAATKNELAYRVAIKYNLPILEPYIIINQYDQWIEEVMIRFAKQNPDKIMTDKEFIEKYKPDENKPGKPAKN